MVAQWAITSSARNMCQRCGKNSRRKTVKDYSAIGGASRNVLDLGCSIQINNKTDLKLRAPQVAQKAASRVQNLLRAPRTLNSTERDCTHSHQEVKISMFELSSHTYWIASLLINLVSNIWLEHDKAVYTLPNFELTLNKSPWQPKSSTNI